MQRNIGHAQGGDEHVQYGQERTQYGQYRDTEYGQDSQGNIQNTQEGIRYFSWSPSPAREFGYDIDAERNVTTLPAQRSEHAQSRAPTPLQAHAYAKARGSKRPLSPGTGTGSRKKRRSEKENRELEKKSEESERWSDVDTLIMLEGLLGSDGPEYENLRSSLKHYCKKVSC